MITLLSLLIAVICPSNGREGALIRRDGTNQQNQRHRHHAHQHHNDFHHMHKHRDRATPGMYDIMEDRDALKNEGDKDKTRKYSEKEQYIALLLSLFFGGIGAGRFYVGHYVIASLKLALFMLTMFTICICWVLPICACQGMISDRASFVHISTTETYCCCVNLLCVVWLAWCITDTVMFMTNDLRDEHGLVLKPIHLTIHTVSSAM